jgi:hypothetical protein
MVLGAGCDVGWRAAPVAQHPAHSRSRLLYNCVCACVCSRHVLHVSGLSSELPGTYTHGVVRVYIICHG